ncbi:MAG: cyclodeaminase/cyclohydrolase family protein [Candidatus Thermoplasmatota archaeon]|nr:cyclodeaminase/cyclohydrolase family protein [Candidatus Thermoplasmatota archaeon]
MNLMEMTMSDYQSALSSKEPTPGGGTASAVALGHSAALISMVASLTIGNDKWQDGWGVSESAIELSSKVMDLSATLAEKDSLAFDKVMEAFRLPKSTEEEKNIRHENIRQATLHAAEIPFDTACLALDLLIIINDLSQVCNGNAVSDIGVAALLASAGCKGALFNVEINMNSLPSEVGQSMRTRLPKINHQCREISKEIMHNVKSRL